MMAGGGPNRSTNSAKSRSFVIKTAPVAFASLKDHAIVRPSQTQVADLNTGQTIGFSDPSRHSRR
jgi:hypothetical protein